MSNISNNQAGDMVDAALRITGGYIKLYEIIYNANKDYIDNIPCQKCSQCCKSHIPVPIETIIIHAELIKDQVQDIDILPLKYNQSFKPLMPILNHINIINKKTGHCPFYSTEKGCNIHEDKPLICKVYPILPDFGISCEYLKHKSEEFHNNIIVNQAELDKNIFFNLEREYTKRMEQLMDKNQINN